MSAMVQDCCSPKVRSKGLNLFVKVLSERGVCPISVSLGPLPVVATPCAGLDFLFSLGHAYVYVRVCECVWINGSVSTLGERLSIHVSENPPWRGESLL